MVTSNIITLLVLENIFILVVCIGYTILLRNKELILKKREKELKNLSIHVDLQAQKRAQIIIEKAEIEAMEIFSQTATFKNNLEESMTQKIQNTLKMYSEMLKNDFVKVGKQVQLTMVQNEVDFSRKSIEAFDEMTKSIETIKSNEYDQMKLELSLYKEKKHKQIEEEMRKQYQKSLNGYLQKALSETDHEEIVLNALKKAQDEGVLI